MPNTQPLPRDIKRHFRTRLAAGRKRGLSARACTALALAGCDTVEQLTALGRAHFEGASNVGAKTLRELSEPATWPAKTPVDAIAAALRLSLPNPEEAVQAAENAMIALRRNGFSIVVARPSALAGR